MDRVRPDEIGALVGGSSISWPHRSAWVGSAGVDESPSSTPGVRRQATPHGHHPHQGSAALRCADGQARQVARKRDHWASSQPGRGDWSGRSALFGAGTRGRARSAGHGGRGWRPRRSELFPILELRPLRRWHRACGTSAVHESAACVYFPSVFAHHGAANRRLTPRPRAGQRSRPCPGSRSRPGDLGYALGRGNAGRSHAGTVSKHRARPCRRCARAAGSVR